MMKVCIHLYALQTTLAQLMHAGDTKKLLRVTQDPGSNFQGSSSNHQGIRRTPGQ